MKCYPWTYEDKVVNGDSVMQSCLYGQGMNAGFEDISVLYEMIEKYGDGGINFSEYQNSRKPNADAIAAFISQFYGNEL
jgi:kynurenine 3-monooxygenase